ncbi:MAG TPA: glycosyltransferase [Steroidobacteraceae bacterium]|nr:glycosyltransferase [Steroidobacteraceae bacterium]
MRVRVGYCVDSFNVGGTELNAVRTAEAVVSADIDLHVFHFHEDGTLRSRYEDLRVPMTHLPIRNLYSPATLLTGVSFGRKLLQSRIHIAHAHDLYTNIFASPWAKLVGRCAVIASRRWLYEAPRPGLVVLNRLSYRFADRVLANSPVVAEMLMSEERIPAEKIVQVPNFLSDKAFRLLSPAERVAKRRQWNIPCSSILLGTVARLAPVKNHALAVEAVARLPENVHLALIGDGPSRSELKQHARELGVADRVHFLGEILSDENLHQFFDIDLNCSQSEGFPNSIVEALAAARPTVATSVGGVPDVIDHNVRGMLFRSNSLDELIGTLRMLLADDELQRRLGDAGRAYVSTHFREASVIKRLVTLYQELAADKSAL